MLSVYMGYTVSPAIVNDWMNIVVHNSFNVVISLVACYVMKPAEAPSAGPAALRRLKTDSPVADLSGMDANDDGRTTRSEARAYRSTRKNAA